MTLIVVDHEKETLHIPVGVWGVYPVEVRMVARAKLALPLRGVKINDLSPLWPAGQFRSAMLQGAATWISQMNKRGYDLHGHEGDTLIYGPWKAKDWRGATARDGIFGADNEGGAQEADMADFRLYARFLARQGRTAVTDHEILSAHAGSLYDEAMKRTHNNVLQAAGLLPNEALPPSMAARLAVQLVDERERRAVREAGLPW